MKQGRHNEVSIFAPEQNAILDVNFPVNLKYQKTDRVVHTGQFPLGPHSVKTVPGKGAWGVTCSSCLFSVLQCSQSGWFTRFWIKWSVDNSLSSHSSARVEASLMEDTPSSPSGKGSELLSSPDLEFLEASRSGQRQSFSSEEALWSSVGYLLFNSLVAASDVLTAFQG